MWVMYIEKLRDDPRFAPLYGTTQRHCHINHSEINDTINCSDCDKDYGTDYVENYSKDYDKHYDEVQKDAPYM